MKPDRQQSRAPTTFYSNTIAIRRPFLITVEGHNYGKADQFTAFIQDVQDPQSSAPDVAAGTGRTEAEALGFALLDLADKPPFERPRPPYIVHQMPNPNRPDEPKFEPARRHQPETV